MTTTVPVPETPAPPADASAADAAAAAPGPDLRYLALRNFAISITVLNILGYTVLGFEQPYLWPILAVLAAYVIDMGFDALTARLAGERPRFLGNGFRGVYEFLLPAHITALAVNMLLYANDQFWPILFGVAVAVMAKYVLRAPVNGRMRHFMNPSNFGITITLLCFGSWVSIAPPYEFTENVNDMLRIAIPLILATAGTILNAGLTKRVFLIIGWLGGFVIQALVRHQLFDISLWAALGPMTGVAFVLFTNYMITDPGTTPSKRGAQFIFGAGVAVTYGVLMELDVVYTLFFAVTIVCGLRGLGWWIAEAVGRRRTAQQARAASEVNGA